MDLPDDAWAAFVRQDYAEAERLYLKAEQTVQTRFGLAYVQAFTGRYEEARAGFEGLRQQAAQRQDQGMEHVMIHQVGMVERMAGRWEQARRCFDAERQIVEQLGNDTLAVSVNAYEQGTVAQHFAEVQAARDWFDTALSAARQTDDLIAVACALRGLGDWSRAFGTVGEARTSWLEALELFGQAGDEAGGAELKMRLAELEEH